MQENLSEELCRMCGIENVDFTKKENLEILFKITNKRKYDENEIKQELYRVEWKK